MAPDQPDARLRLAAGSLTVDPQYDQLPPPADLRRQAANELKRRRIDHLLVFDGQFGADDLRAHANEWGVRALTEYKGATLYQLP
jgi:hypothetical protein